VAFLAANLKEKSMDGLHSSDSSWTLDFLAGMHLISACERMQVNAVLGDFLLEPCLDRAETIHLHVKLDDTDRLSIACVGGRRRHSRPWPQRLREVPHAGARERDLLPHPRIGRRFA
jgi:hypothetical protein